MKKIAEIFRQACIDEKIPHYYYGNASSGALDEYDNSSNAYVFAGSAKDFPFFALLVEGKTVDFNNRTDKYTLSLHYGDLPDSERRDTMSLHEAGENVIIRVLQKAKEISNQKLLYFAYSDKIDFEYNIITTPTRFVITSATIDIITR